MTFIDHNWFYNINTMLKYVLSLISVIKAGVLIRNINTHKKELTTCFDNRILKLHVRVLLCGYTRSKYIQYASSDLYISRSCTNLILFILDTLVNSEDPDEMPHYAAFHQGLYCSLTYNHIFMTEMHHHLETSSCDPLKYKKGDSVLIGEIHQNEKV